jgi:hypothetical protein
LPEEVIGTCRKVVAETNVKAPKEFSWRDAANLIFLVGALPLLLLAAWRGELARRAGRKDDSPSSETTPIRA